MKDQEFDRVAELGRENQRAVTLLASHCGHASLEIPGGTSTFGAMVGLPIGMARVRCPHASTPGAMSMHGMDLAVAFYEDNCGGCAHRRPNGVLPTIATEVEERRQRGAAANEEAVRATAAALDQWERRREARRAAVSIEGYPVRDLADDLDMLDPRPRQSVDESHEDVAAAAADEAARARRRLVETARRAPQLFNRRLADAVVALAEDRLDPTSCTVVRLLARSGQVPVARAAAVGATVLGRRPSTEAGQLVAEFAQELAPAGRAEAVAGAVTLCGDDDDSFMPRRRAAEPSALLALAAVDLPLVTERVTSALQNDSDWVRADAGEAARHLLMSDPSRVVALGGPLVASIRGRDEGYAGTPSPGAAAARALAEAWRGEPDATCQVMERGGPALDEKARAVLGGVIGFLRRWDDPTPIPDQALRTAVRFLLLRLDEAWGSEVADQATDDLLRLAEDYPSAVLPSADAILGALLATFRDRPASPLAPPQPEHPLAAQVRLMEETSDRIRRSGRRTDLAGTLGLLARLVPGDLVPKISALLAATTGDDDLDSKTRSSLVEALAKSVTPATVESVLPTLYTCLLSLHQGVRASAVSLWQACAENAETLPEDLTDLAPTLLGDPYVVVHKAMLRACPRLGLPPATTALLLQVYAAIANVYAGRDSDALDYALRGVLWSARSNPDDGLRRAADLWVLGRCSSLERYDRERLLLDERLGWLHPTQAWATAAVTLLADPGRQDRFNSRDDRLLASLLETPAGMRDMPTSEFRAAADIHLPEFPSAAAEPVALLQAAGRWVDAATLATHLVDQVPQTREHASRRRYLADLAAAAQAEQAAAAGDPPTHVTAPPAGHAAGNPGRKTSTSNPRGDDEPSFAQLARARAAFREELLKLPSADPVGAAVAADLAASHMSTAAFGQRDLWHADALRCAAHLLRHDHAVRMASDDALTHLMAARRTAAVLAAAARTQLDPGDPLLGFAQAVADLAVDQTVAGIDDLLVQIRDLPFLLPLWVHALRRRSPTLTHPAT